MVGVEGMTTPSASNFCSCLRTSLRISGEFFQNRGERGRIALGTSWMPIGRNLHGLRMSVLKISLYFSFRSCIFFCECSADLFAELPVYRSVFGIERGVARLVVDAHVC